MVVLGSAHCSPSSNLLFGINLTSGLHIAVRILSLQYQLRVCTMQSEYSHYNIQQSGLHNVVRIVIILFLHIDVNCMTYACTLMLKDLWLTLAMFYLKIKHTSNTVFSHCSRGKIPTFSGAP